MIRGKKNYLPQTQLVMGFSLFFRLDEESIVNHLDDRKVKYVELEENIDSNEVDQDDEEMAFPDTKIRTISKSEHDQDMILEAMKPRLKTQKKIKPVKQDKKIEQNDKPDKPSNPVKQSNQKNKKSKGKSKRSKKDDEWSDDEDKINLKLNKKLQKDNRLQDLDDQTRLMNLNDESEDEQIEDNLNDEKEIDVKQSNEQSDQNGDQTETLKSEQKIDESSDSEDDKIEYDEEEEENEEETNDERREIEYLKLVNSLTDRPLNNDVLMYCVPVVAPYTAVTNSKFRVKVLPGTNKRGRSAKTALQLFLNDKKLTQRERDLLKSIKDLDIARNLPPKIKITAQHLQQVKRKK